VKLLILLAAFAGPLFLSQQIDLVKTRINDSVTVALPRDFRLMTTDETSQNYPSAGAVPTVYTNAAGTVDFGVNVAFSRWRDSDIEVMKSFYKSNILNLYDSVDFIRDEIQEINGRQYAIFEFLSRVEGDDYAAFSDQAINQYVYIQYTISNYRTILFHFNSPGRYQQEWAPVARAIMQSVQIK
jgi:hypothetical protein